ncbi:hypothetical protein CCP3SC1AL1_2080001 [Gammaproteobacteria bacterium]
MVPILLGGVAAGITYLFGKSSGEDEGSAKARAEAARERAAREQRESRRRGSEEFGVY